MAQVEDFLADVHPRYHEWNFNVYVIRMWDVSSKNNPKVTTHTELILQDSKGDRIHAVLNRALLRRWGGVLAEFKMFNMRRFIVVENNMKSRTTQTNYVLTFSNRTAVNPMANPSFPLRALRLRSIGEILRADRINEAEMFDVVALVVGRGDSREMQSKTGKDLKRLSIVVEGLEKNKISCALFDGHVDAILPHLDEPRDGPLIVVLHYFKATRWNGKTSLQSNFDVSKVHVNPDIAEVVAFREGLGVDGQRTSSRISRVSSRSRSSGTNELAQGNVNVLKIEDVLRLSEERDAWIAGSVVALNVGEKDRYYQGCGGCGKKVETTPDGSYQCGQCHHTSTDFKIKYKVEVLAYDRTHCITLLLWDSAVVPLCGKKADEIIGEDTEELGYPLTLDNILEKRAQFKINVRASNYEKDDKVYIVDLVCEDEDLVNKYLPEDSENEPTVTDVEIGSSNSVDVSNPVANPQANGTHQSDMYIGEKSVSGKTPLKRTMTAIDLSESELQLEGQHSTNKFSRRVPRKSKVQIIDDDN